MRNFFNDYDDIYKQEFCALQYSSCEYIHVHIVDYSYHLKSFCILTSNQILHFAEAQACSSIKETNALLDLLS